MRRSIWHNIVLMNTLNSNPGQLLASPSVTHAKGREGRKRQSTFPSLSSPLSKHIIPSVGCWRFFIYLFIFYHI